MIYFICFFAAGVVVFPFFIIVGQLRATKRHKDKLYNKAVSRGHEATAFLKRSYSPLQENPRSPTDRMELGKYYFDYNGKRYNIRLYFDGAPPEEVQVYWLSNPRKAGTKGGISDPIWPWLIFYLIVFCIALWVAKS